MFQLKVLVSVSLDILAFGLCFRLGNMGSLYLHMTFVALYDVSGEKVEGYGDVHTCVGHVLEEVTCVSLSFAADLTAPENRMAGQTYLLTHTSFHHY